MLAINDVLLFTVFLNEQTGRTKVVPRHPGEEMMRDLEVQSTMEKLDVGRTFHVHRCPQLAGWEGLSRSQIIGRAGKVREYDLKLAL